MIDRTEKRMRNPTFARRLGFIFVDVIILQCAAIPSTMVHQFLERDERCRTNLQQQKR